MTHTLAIDLSTQCGWALFKDDQLVSYGVIVVKVDDFNVNNDPNLSPKYPYNIIDSADEMANKVFLKYTELGRPDHIVIENSVKGKNRHTQRLIEFYHKSLLDTLRSIKHKVNYMDPSEWRSILNIRMSKEDKKNNRDVYTGKKRGKITRKHLSVRMVNELFNLKLKLKNNNEADAICLGLAFAKKGNSLPR